MKFGIGKKVKCTFVAEAVYRLYGPWGGGGGGRCSFSLYWPPGEKGGRGWGSRPRPYIYP
jgi:hypothetical protein